MSMLDDLLTKTVVTPDGQELPDRSRLQFKGAVSVVDSPTTGRTIVTITGSGGGPSELSGDVTGPSDATVVEAIRGVHVSPAPGTPTQVLTRDASGCGWADPAIPAASAVPFDPAGTGMSATRVQAAIVEAFNKPPSSDATKIQGVSVSTAALLEGQSLVRNDAGVYVPRFTSPSSDRLITTSGTKLAALGENLYIDVASGDVDVKLPASPVIGATVRVKRLSTNASLVTVDGNGATIDGDTAIAIKPHEAALFRCYAAGKWARLGKCEAVAQGSVRHLGLEYDPIALWKLDGDLLDSSGNGRHLSGLSGPYGYVTPTGGFGCLLLATGTVTANLTAALYDPLFLADDITVQAIVYAIPGIERSIGRAWGFSNDQQANWNLYIGTDSAGIRWRNAAGTSTVNVAATAVSTNGWLHLAATRRLVDGRAIGKVYVNGTKLVELGDLDPPRKVTGTRSMYMGRDATGTSLQAMGMAGSLKVSRTLTDAEVYAEAQKAGLAP